MEQHVSVGMSDEARRMGDIDSTQPERTTGFESMDIEA
jgi:hypothetical protein